MASRVPEPEKSECDFTRPVDDIPGTPSAIAASEALEARYGRRYRVKRSDEDYQVTFLGAWLTQAEANEWIVKLRAEESAWNPSPGFGNTVSYFADTMETPVTKGARAAPGDVMIHRLVEPFGEFRLGDTQVFVDFYLVAQVLEVDARGCVSSFRDRQGTHTRTPSNPLIVSAGVIHADAVMEFLSLREAERGEYGRYAVTFTNAKEALRRIAGFIRPRQTVYPSLPDRGIPDPRVTRRFPSRRMYAAKSDIYPGGYGAISLLSHDAKQTGLPLVEVAVEEIDAPRPGCFWAWKQRNGLVFIQATVDAITALMPNRIPAEIERGYGLIVPVSVTETHELASIQVDSPAARGR
jgi:hypothetical protein